MTLKLVVDKPKPQKVIYGKDFVNLAGMKMIFCEWGPKSFWMSATPVTRGHYDGVAGPPRFADTLKRAVDDEYGMSEAEQALLPKVSVDRTEAVSFCMQLTRSAYESAQLPADHRYKLPTEAQWLHAFYTGSKERPEDLESIAWFGEGERKLPHLVGQKAPNAWGFHDMLGNVWEWCSGFTKIEEMTPCDEAVYLEKSYAPDLVVTRGGSWRVAADEMHWNIWRPTPPRLRDIDLGFRVILCKSRYKPMKIVAAEMVG